MRRVNDVLIAGSTVMLVAAIALPAEAVVRCPDGSAPIYLTFDTGSQSQAKLIHDVLKKHGVHATFFLASEKTVSGDRSLDPSWAAYWKMLVAEGHAFGTHTFDHVYYLGDQGADAIRVRPQFGAHAGQVERWDERDYCAELDRVATRFAELTGSKLDAFWRAPGGKTSPRLIAFGRACGYRHFGWSAAGFLGDELPSERYPNALLLDRALRTIKPGDIVMSHLGIWSRKQPLAPILDPLLTGLEAQGRCFATLRDYPAGAAS